MYWLVRSHSKSVLLCVSFPFGLSLSKPNGSPFDKLRTNGLNVLQRGTP